MNMKNIRKKMITMLFLLLLIMPVVSLPGTKAEAAPAYKKLYQKYLTTHRKYDKKFYILNVDQKGVPELITSSGSMGIGGYKVFTVKKGSVVQIGDFVCKGGSSCLYYNRKYKGLYASGWTNGIGGSWGNVYVISNGKLRLKYHAREAHNPKDVYYYGKNDVSAKKVSRSAYKKYVKKYMSNYKSYEMKDNTPSNRKKI